MEKAVYTWDPNTSDWESDPDPRLRFVWSDWLLVLELDATDPNDVTVLRKYTWGLDLGGTGVSPVIDSAGGIGGLLAAYDADSGKDYLYFHDANGNVGQLIDRSDGSIAAKYEYDPYGNNLLDPNDPNESGPYADDNPFRFSTKYFDDETGLGYWGYRYYSPKLGRFINRDPISEPGFMFTQQSQMGVTTRGSGFIPRDLPPAPFEDDRANTYTALSNHPISYIDPLGATSQQGGGKKYKAGPMHPECCYAVFGLCLLQGNSISQCSAYFKQCWNRSIPNPCHAGRILDPMCWFVRGSKGCKKPDICFFSLFPLCDVRFGTHPKTGQPIYGAHLFRFCRMRLSWPIIHIGTMTEKWPAGCMDACEDCKKRDKAHALKNCGCDYSCVKCEDMCGDGPHPTFVGGWGTTPPKPVY